MDISEQTVIINPHSMLPVGTLLQNGKYRIERHLSSGDFGNTYVATNTDFEEQVAVKEFFIRGVIECDGDFKNVSVSKAENYTTTYNVLWWFLQLVPLRLDYGCLIFLENKVII